ncbi:MAG: hypothetical protein ACYC1L_13240 [Alphaproteobacteria bacterium]
MTTGISRRVASLESAAGSGGRTWVVVLAGAKGAAAQVSEWFAARGIQRQVRDTVIAVNTGIER